MTIALIVPVLKRFDLFTKLMASVDVEIKPYIIDNYNGNRGVSGAWNEGIRRAMNDGHQYAIISNDDVVFDPNSIEKIYNSLKESDAVLISANQNGQTISDIELVENCDFFCFGINMGKLVSTAGYFDENFYPAYFEDNDMAYRIKLSGEKFYIHTGAIARHEGSATQNADPNNPVCPSETFQGLREYFRTKWGGTPGEERFTKPFNIEEKEIWDWDERIQ